MTYYASATLVEFTQPDDLERALVEWPVDPAVAGPIRISDRLLLVEDANSIPFGRFRLAGSRDYRRQPEPCVEVEPDGVTLGLDLGRSDLLVDAELARFADETARPLPPADASASRPSRSPARSESGLTAPVALALVPPARRRRPARGDPPPAPRRGARRASPIAAIRPLVLSVPSESLLDGLLQHPETSPYLGDRLGPTAVVVVESLWPRLREVLSGLGLPFVGEDESPIKARRK